MLNFYFSFFKEKKLSFIFAGDGFSSSAVSAFVWQEFNSHSKGSFMQLYLTENKVIQRNIYYDSGNFLVGAFKKSL